MPPDGTYEEGAIETPLERAAREEAEARTPAGADARAEREADVVIGDVDEYVARTDPASLPEAERQLDAWEIPGDPLEGVPDDVALAPDAEGEPLESVFSAGSESEANIVRGLLEAEGIPAMFRDASVPDSFGAVFGVAEARYADILVPASQAEAARQVIAAAQQPSPEMTETAGDTNA